MKFKTVSLYVSAVFPPLLALIIGLSLVVRTVRETGLAKRFAEIDNALNKVLDLNVAGQMYLQNPGAPAMEQWRLRHEGLTRSLIGIRFERRAQLSLVDAMLVDSLGLQSVFQQLATAVEKRREGDASEELELAQKRLSNQLLLKSQAVISGAFHLVQAYHMDADMAQRNMDSILILLSACVATLMAGAAYLVVKEEITARRAVSQALRESDIQLSDAVVKLRRARDQAMRYEHLHALSQAARALVHESRNAITPVVSGADFLSTVLKDSQRPGVRESLDVLGRAADRLESQMNRFSMFLHAGPDRSAEVNVKAMVQDVVSAAKEQWRDRAAGGEIAVELSLPDDLPPVEADPGDIRELIANIVDNAADAMAGGGKLSVHAMSEGGWVALEVEDTGVGMTEDVRRRCLEPFFSTKGVGYAGMGLAVVDSIVRRYRGTLDIASTFREGTTVVACLPMKAEKPAVGGFTADFGAPTGLRILVVDDASWLRLTLSKQLVSDGHVPESAVNGSEGLKKLREGTYDLVLTDRAMPDMSGEEFAEAAKRINPTVPVVLVTGLAEAVDLKSKSMSCIDAVISKPIAPEDLRRAIAKVMKKT